MIHTFRRGARPAVLAALVLAFLPVAVAAQGKWWQSERFQRELQLTSDQIAKIEEVFQKAVPKLREQKKELDQLESALARMIDTSADEAAVLQEADRVEAVRSELSKSRTKMLLRIRRVLSAEQRAKFRQLHDEWERERRRDGHRK